MRLTVYNVRGQPVATLVDEERPAVRFAVEWNGGGMNGNGLSSGMYFYRIVATSGQATFVDVRKMLLMK